MITIAIKPTDETQVQLTIRGKSLWTLYFNRQCHSGYEAVLTRQDLMAGLGDVIEEIRRTEYNRGWCDAKSKQVKKKTYFYRGF